MDQSHIHPAQNVQQILAGLPPTALVFMRLHTACVGCCLSRFCTLDDVAANYGLSVPTLVENLHAAVKLSKSIHTGVQNEIVT